MRLSTLVALLFVLHTVELRDQRWTVGRQLLLDPTVVCRKTKRLKEEQLSACREKPNLIRAIETGAVQSVKECQHQFQSSRWNCSNRGRAFKRILLRDTPEMGFLSAIIAAGITHAVTLECSLGKDMNCPCRHGAVGQRTSNEWKWGGCDDSIKFGQQSAVDFLEPGLKTPSDTKEKIVTHNYEAGRRAVKNSMRDVCRHHGTSGSSALQTCWKRVTKFRVTGDLLKNKHNTATKMTVDNNGHELTPVESSTKLPNKEDIIYMENSPVFCEPNKKMGSLGTHGRKCDLNSKSEGNCRTLCCGRGYETTVVRMESPCNCTFHWCCEVNCETCVTAANVSNCL